MVPRPNSVFDDTRDVSVGVYSHDHQRNVPSIFGIKLQLFELLSAPPIPPPSMVGIRVRLGSRHAFFQLPVDVQHVETWMLESEGD